MNAAHPWRKSRAPEIRFSRLVDDRRSYANEWEQRMEAERLAGVTDPKAHELMRQHLSGTPRE